MTIDRQFSKKYGYPFFDVFQDENAFKHSSRNEQKAVLENQIQEARSQMEYHYTELDRLERNIKDALDELEKINPNQE